jgi:hypothetical protein
MSVSPATWEVETGDNLGKRQLGMVEHVKHRYAEGGGRR